MGRTQGLALTPAQVCRRAADLLEQRLPRLVGEVSDRCYAELASYRTEQLPRVESRRALEQLLAALIARLRGADGRGGVPASIVEELVRVEEGIAARRVRFQIGFEDLLTGVSFLREAVWALLQVELRGELDAQAVYDLQAHLGAMVDRMFIGLASSYTRSQAEVIQAHERSLLQWEEVVRSASRIHLKIPCEEQFVGIVRMQAEAVARRLGYGEEEVYDILTSVGEVCDNAIEHGRSERGIDVEYLMTREAMRVEIVDYGPGFDPHGLGDEVPDLMAEGGRGLFLMKQLMDEVTFESVPGRGTRVLLSKRLRAPLSLQ